MKPPRRDHSAASRAKVALAAVEGDQTLAENLIGLYRTEVIHQRGP